MLHVPQAIGLACPGDRIGHLLDIRLMQQPSLRLGYVLGWCAAAPSRAVGKHERQLV
jgi:hypothetical protein